MGKAMINSHLGSGQYSITYYRDITYATTRIAELQELRTKIESEIYGTDGLYDTKQEAEYQYQQATLDFDYWLDLWAQCAKQLPPCEDLNTYKANMEKAAETRSGYAQALTYINLQIAEKKAAALSALYEIGFLNSTADEAVVINAWSVDYPKKGSPVPSGTIVGTVESNGAKLASGGGWLPDPYINIVPTFDGTSAYSASRDHCVKPMSAMSTASALNNYCQFLNAMASNPQYGVGIIQSVNEATDTATVRLYGAHSSKLIPAGYPFDPGTYYITLTDIPVEYMDCNASAFAAGDSVVVEFSNVALAGPKVIGFTENPKMCTEHLGNWLVRDKGTWTATSTGYVWAANLTPKAGNVTYANAHGLVSWYGCEGVLVGHYVKHTGNQLFHNGVAYTAGAATNMVVGGSIVDISGTTYVLAIAMYPAGRTWYAYKAEVGGSTTMTLVATIACSTDEWMAGIYSPSLWRKPPVFFDSSGLHGVTLQLRSADPTNANNSYPELQAKTMTFDFSADLSSCTRSIGSLIGNAVSGQFSHVSASSTRESYQTAYWAAYYDATDTIQLVTCYAKLTSVWSGNASDRSMVQNAELKLYVGGSLWHNATSTFTCNNNHATEIGTYSMTGNGLTIAAHSNAHQLWATGMVNSSGDDFFRCVDPRNRESLMTRSQSGGASGSGEFITNAYEFFEYSSRQIEVRAGANNVVLAPRNVDTIYGTEYWVEAYPPEDSRMDDLQEYPWWKNQFTVKETDDPTFICCVGPTRVALSYSSYRYKPACGHTDYTVNAFYSTDFVGDTIEAASGYTLLEGDYCDTSTTDFWIWGLISE